MRANFLYTHGEILSSHVNPSRQWQFVQSIIGATRNGLRDTISGSVRIMPCVGAMA